MTHSLPICAILLMSRTYSPNIGMYERMYVRTCVRICAYVGDIVRTIPMSSSRDSMPSQMAWRPSLTLAGREVGAT